MSQQRPEWPEKAELARLVHEAQCDDHLARETLLAVLRPHFVSFFACRLMRDAADNLAQNALLSIAGRLNLLRTAYRRRTIDRRRHADVNLIESPDSRDSAVAVADYEDMVLAVHVIAARLLAPL